MCLENMSHRAVLYKVEPYPMKMERMLSKTVSFICRHYKKQTYRSTNRVSASNTNLDDLVPRNGINTSCGKQVLSSMLSGQDLEKDREGWVDIADVVDQKPASREAECEVESVIGATQEWLSGGFGIPQGTECGFSESGRVGKWISDDRLSDASTFVSQDARVDTILESCGSCKVGLGTNPVVVYGLIRMKNERISLASKDAEIVHDVRLNIDTICLDDGELVAVD